MRNILSNYKCVFQPFREFIHMSIHLYDRQKDNKTKLIDI